MLCGPDSHRTAKSAMFPCEMARYIAAYPGISKGIPSPNPPCRSPPPTGTGWPLLQRFDLLNPLNRLDCARDLRRYREAAGQFELHFGLRIKPQNKGNIPIRRAGAAHHRCQPEPGRRRPCAAEAALAVTLGADRGQARSHDTGPALHPCRTGFDRDRQPPPFCIARSRRRSRSRRSASSPRRKR